MIGKTKLGNKILVAFLAVGLLPFLLVSMMSLIKSSQALSEQTFSQLESLREIKKQQIEHYFSMRRTELAVLMETVDTLRQAALEKHRGIQVNKKAQVEHFFKDQAQNLKVFSKSTTVIDALKRFITAYGSERSGKVGGQYYDFLKSLFEGSFEQFKSAYGYEDIYLIDKEGNIVYSVSHQTDEGQNLKTGSLKRSPLAKSFKKGLIRIAIQDFKPYSASGNRHYAFMAAPVFDQIREDFLVVGSSKLDVGGQMAGAFGVVAVKINHQMINTIVQRREGMGKTGETYIVGKLGDRKTYRTDRMVKQGRIGEIKDGFDIDAAIRGVSGQDFKIGDAGDLLITSYDPLEIQGLQWAMITTMRLEEAINPRFHGQADYFTTYRDHFVYDDLLLIHPNGTVFYTVARNADYSTNVVQGQFADSGLGEIFRKVMLSKQFEFVDFSLYAPDNYEPAAFIAQPVLRNDTVEVVVALRLSINSINQIMQERSGMGKTGETYLVGSDKLMRSDIYQDPEHHSVKTSFTDPSKGRVDTVASRQALAGFDGKQIIADYRGSKVLSAFTPVQVGDTTWALIAEIDEAEAFATISALKYLLVVIAVLGVVVIITIALLTTRSITRPISHLTEAAVKVTDGDLDIRTNLKTKDETKILGSAFNRMLDRIKSQLLEITQVSEERRQAEQEVRKLNTELEQRVIDRTAELTRAKEYAEAANSAKSEFLARMSHEIRTPLNAVTGRTNVVLKSELTDEQRDYLNKVRIASNNLLEVINDILDFSRVEAGRLELTNAPFDLDQLLEQLADLFSNRVAQKDLELIFDTSPDVPRQLTGDAGRLTQVLTNLIENAVKFTETGEIIIGVELDEQIEKPSGQRAIKFQVSDTGSGITADVLPNLFDPFTQADTSLTRQHEGTGLGLAICWRLVELMGGTITAQSTPGQGSRFAFTLIMVVKKEEKPQLITPPDLHGLKTLVVDDSAAARQVLVDLLESFTFNVSAVDSGGKALKAVQKAAVDEPFKLVLMDWKMPGMDGLETARCIRKLEDQKPETQNQKPQIPIIIMVTAYGLELVQGHMDIASVDTSLLKPVKPSQLFNTIMALFGRKEAEVPRIKIKKNAIPGHLAGRRVLVVEDSELNRDVVVALLEETGLAVEFAVNGQVAVDKVTQSPKGYYDAVLMDIQMPVMDGYAATRHIREWESRQPKTMDHKPKSKLPVIALTAHALKDEKEKCLAADMDDYLSKPLDERDLYRMLVKWIALQPEEADTAIRLQSRGTSDDQGVLDLKGALKRLGGQRQLYGKVLRKFESESAKAHAIITRHIATSDMEAALRMAHTVKGAAAAIGAVNLSKVVAELETAIRDNSSETGNLLSVFKSELEKTMQSVNEFLEAESEGYRL
jgi:methyl-accepting chemotaxis protein